MFICGLLPSCCCCCCCWWCRRSFPLVIPVPLTPKKPGFFERHWQCHNQTRQPRELTRKRRKKRNVYTYVHIHNKGGKKQERLWGLWARLEQPRLKDKSLQACKHFSKSKPNKNTFCARSLLNYCTANIHKKKKTKSWLIIIFLYFILCVCVSFCADWIVRKFEQAGI